MITRKGESVRLTDGEVLHAEAVDRELDRLAEKRSRDFGSEAATEFARQQARAERERVEDRSQVVLELWKRHHARMQAVHTRLAQEHEARAARLASSARNGSGP